MAGHRIYRTSVASVYPHYVSKAEKKGRTKEEVDEILCWLTGYGASELGAQLEQGTDFERFFAEAPALNPSRKLITGVICGVRVEEIEDPLMQEIRYLDKLVDELARGKAMEKILRTGCSCPGQVGRVFENGELDDQRIDHHGAAPRLLDYRLQVRQGLRRFAAHAGMVNWFTTSVEQYRPEFADEKLDRHREPARDRAVWRWPDPRSYEEFTYWDSAIANLQVLEALGIPEAFALGTPQGGMDRDPHGDPRARHREGHHPAGDLDGLREPAQPRPGVLDDRILYCGHPLLGNRREATRRSRATSSTPPRRGVGRGRAAGGATFWHTTYQKNYTAKRGGGVSASAP